MKLACPHCGAQYDVIDVDVPPDGLRVECQKCLRSFVATGDGRTSPGENPKATSAKMVAIRGGAGAPGYRLDVSSTAHIIDEIDELVESAFTRPKAPSPPAKGEATLTGGPPGFFIDDRQLDQLDDLPSLDGSDVELVMEDDGSEAGQSADARLDEFDFSFTNVPMTTSSELDESDPTGGFRRDETLIDPPPADSPVTDFDIAFGDLGTPPGGSPARPGSERGGLDSSPSMGSGLRGFVDELLDDLPAPVGASPRDQVIDLPGLRPGPELPAPKGGDLPRRKFGPTDAFDPAVPPPPPLDVDDLDLELPAPKFGVGLPGLRASADLPAPKVEPELPAPKVGAELPVPKVGVELPAPKVGAELPVPRVGSELPTPSVGAELPTPRVDSDVPVPKIAAEVPVPKVGEQPPVPKVGAEVPGEAIDWVVPVDGQVAGESEPFSLDDLDLDLPAPKGQVARPPMPGALDPFDIEIAPEPSGAVPLSFPHDTELVAEPSVELSLDSEFVLEELEPEIESDVDPDHSTRQSRIRPFAIAASALLAVAAGAVIWLLMPSDGPDDVEAGTRAVAESSPEPSGEATDPEGGGPDRGDDVQAEEEKGTEVPAVRATLVEVGAYRKEIARRELEGATDVESVIRLVEVYSFGALEFPGNRDWASNAMKLAGSLDEATKKSVAGRRAVIVARLAARRPNALPQAEKLAKEHPEDALAQYMLGHAYLRKDAVSNAFDAFDAATKLDPELLAAWKMAGMAALRSHRLERAVAAFEEVDKVVPGVPSVLNGLALAALYRREFARANERVQLALRTEEARLSVHDRSSLLVTQARINQATGHEAAALARYAEAIKVWPKNTDAVVRLSKLHITKGNFEDALTLYETLQIAGVHSPKVAMGIAECHVALKHPRRAMDALEKAAMDFPDEPSLRVKIGNVHASQRRWKRARASYQKALELDPRYHHAHLRIAEMLAEEGRYEKATEYLRAKISENRTSAELHLGLGRLLMGLPEASQSQAIIPSIEMEFELAQQLDPALIESKLHLATLQLWKSPRRPEKTLELLEELQAAGFERDMTVLRGRAYLALGQCRRAIEAFNTAIARRPRDSTTMLMLGKAHFACIESEEARRLLAEVISLDGRLTEAHYLLGRIFLNEGNFAAAVQKLEYVHQEDPNDLEYYYWLGRALEVSGQRVAARDAYHGVCEAAIHDPRAMLEVCDAFYRRALARMEKFDYEGAEADLRRVVRCDDERADVWIKWGDIYEVRQRHQQAIEKYKEASKRDSSLADPYEKIGQAYLLMDDTEKAIPVLEKAIKLDPRKDDVHYMLCAIFRDKGRRTKALRYCQDFIRRADPKDARRDDVFRTIAGLKRLR